MAHRESAKIGFADDKKAPKRFRPDPKHTYHSASLTLERPRKWYQDRDVVVCFNSPELSLRLRKLMGTCVFRLNDENYIKELKKAIREHNKAEQQKRIDARMQQELDRERRMIFAGLQTEVPHALSRDSILRVRKRVAQRVEKLNATLKTSRQKNADILKARAKTVEEVLTKADERRRVLNYDQYMSRQERRALRNKYIAEEENAGLDLLRIHVLGWRKCEDNLVDFLQNQRIAFREQADRKKLLASRDPKDVQIIREKPLRKAIQREKDMRIWKEHEKMRKEDIRRQYILTLETKRGSKLAMSLAEENAELESYRRRLEQARALDNMADDEARLMVKYGSDTTYKSLSDEEHHKITCEDPEVIKERLEAEMENDLQRGLLVSKQQMQRLSYEDEKLKQLRNADNMVNFYSIVEEIIMGERIVEEIVVQEEEEEEQEDVIEDDDED